MVKRGRPRSANSRSTRLSTPEPVHEQPAATSMRRTRTRAGASGLDQLAQASTELTDQSARAARLARRKDAAIEEEEPVVVTVPAPNGKRSARQQDPEPEEKGDGEEDNGNEDGDTNDAGENAGEDEDWPTPPPKRRRVQSVDPNYVYRLEVELDEMKSRLRKTERLLDRHTFGKTPTNYSAHNSERLDLVQAEIVRLETTMASLVGRTRLTSPEHAGTGTAAAVESLRAIQDTLAVLQGHLTNPVSFEGLDYHVRPMFDRLWVHGRESAEDDIRSKLAFWKYKALDMKGRVLAALSGTLPPHTTELLQNAFDFLSSFSLLEMRLDPEMRESRQKQQTQEAVERLHDKLVELETQRLNAWTRGPLAPTTWNATDASSSGQTVEPIAEPVTAQPTVMTETAPSLQPVQPSAPPLPTQPISRASKPTSLSMRHGESETDSDVDEPLPTPTHQNTSKNPSKATTGANGRTQGISIPSEPSTGNTVGAREETIAPTPSTSVTPAPVALAASASSVTVDAVSSAAEKPTNQVLVAPAREPTVSTASTSNQSATEDRPARSTISLDEYSRRSKDANTPATVSSDKRSSQPNVDPKSTNESNANDATALSKQSQEEEHSKQGSSPVSSDNRASVSSKQPGSKRKRTPSSPPPPSSTEPAARKKSNDVSKKSKSKSSSDVALLKKILESRKERIGGTSPASTAAASPASSGSSIQIREPSKSKTASTGSSVSKKNEEKRQNGNGLLPITKPAEAQKLSRSRDTTSPSSGCSACKQNDSYASLLLCDNDCGREYHTFCLSPPLSKIPEGDWYCPRCLKREGLRQNGHMFRCSVSTCNKITAAKYCYIHRCQHPEGCLNRTNWRGLCRRHYESKRDIDHTITPIPSPSTDTIPASKNAKPAASTPSPSTTRTVSTAKTQPITASNGKSPSANTTSEKSQQSQHATSSATKTKETTKGSDKKATNNSETPPAVTISTKNQPAVASVEKATPSTSTTEKSTQLPASPERSQQGTTIGAKPKPADGGAATANDSTTRATKSSTVAGAPRSKSSKETKSNSEALMDNMRQLGMWMPTNLVSSVVKRAESNPSQKAHSSTTATASTKSSGASTARSGSALSDAPSSRR